MMSPHILSPVTRMLVLIVALVLFLNLGVDTNPSTICDAQGTCPEPAAYGRQPYVSELAPVFNQAGMNQLAQNGPGLPNIWSGYPLSQAKSITPYVPCILLKAIGYTETTGWKQFNANYGQWGNTRISTDCGYGIMQITSAMDGSGGFEPHRVAAEPAYNIGTGAKFLIGKWNALEFYVGANNPHVVEDWYYTVWFYNGWGWFNNPNNERFAANRGVWECGANPTQNRGNWPYQELIWGCAANPPGSEYWEPVNLTLPSRASLNSDPPPVHINTPQPAHGSCSIIHLPLALNNYPSCLNPIVNGGFEDGITGWTKAGLVGPSTQHFFSGQSSAWFGGYNNAAEALYQIINIPATGPTGAPIATATLSYYWYMVTEESTHPYDYFYAKLKNPYNSSELATLQTLNDGDTPNSWTFSSFDLSSYVGQSVRPYFLMSSDRTYPTSFYLDDVAVQVCEPW